MDHFAGQSGREVALKCVEVIARGTVSQERGKRIVRFGNFLVSLVADSRWIESRFLRAKGKKKEEYWMLSGFEDVEKDREYVILEFAVGHGSAAHQSEGMPAALCHSPRPLEGEPPKSTHTGPIVCPPRMGAADSIENTIPDSRYAGTPWQKEEPGYGTTAHGFSLNIRMAGKTPASGGGGCQADAITGVSNQHVRIHIQCLRHFAQHIHGHAPLAAFNLIDVRGAYVTGQGKLRGGHIAIFTKNTDR